MNRSAKKFLALGAILTMGIGLAACSSSSSTSGAAPKQGKPLVVVNNTGATFVQSFNPYVSTTLGVMYNMQSLTYEPLLMFNTMNPKADPILWLATGYAWSNGGKTLTFTIRQDVKFSDGSPMTASDVAYTFNLLKGNPLLASQAPGPSPMVASATAPDAATAVLTFSKPQYASLFLIASTYVLPEHLWKDIKDPAKYADPNPVGTGPYVMSSFTSQKVTFKQNQNYWQKSIVRVPQVIFPAYTSNNTANPALARGEIGYAGNNVTDVKSNFLDVSPNNHTWASEPPYYASNNVVALWLNVTKPPLNDLKVRQAISAGINRQQLSAQGESGYAPPATSSGGLLLPTDTALLHPSYINDLKATSDSAKVTQLLTSDGYTKVNGKWMKNGQPIKFSIQDPTSYTDYATSATLIANQLNALGFEVSFDGVADTAWYSNYPVGNFDAIIHWSQQGPSPYFWIQNWIDSTLTAPIGKVANGDYGRFSSPAAQAALEKYAGTDNKATQQEALNALQEIISTQAPVIPLFYGAAWYQYSTKDYTGWPTASNPYINPVPNSPYLLYTLLHLTPAG